ncbi:hypothetical protein HZS_2195 [Henneguya salminicola]|nr:hypothetical protein HZS_2195 [Henneguya salminicola]
MSEKKKVLETENENISGCSECCNINKHLFIPKSFYFTFFSAWGALLPYLALHFKQMLMNPTQVGVLMGLKPFINFVSIPIWGIIVDRYRLQRLVLLISMIALVLSTFAIVFIPSPEDTIKILMLHCNKTDMTYWESLLSQRGYIHNNSDNKALIHQKAIFKLPRFEEYSYSWPLDLASNYSNDQSEFYVDSTFTFVEIFMALFFGTLIGSPSLALVDTATINMLGCEAHKYGRQRLFGSLGWGLAAFIVGASLTPSHRCFLKHRVDIIDYSPCFYTFGIMMSVATVITFGFSFSNNSIKDKTNDSDRGNSISLRKGLEVLNSPVYIMFLLTALMMGFQMSFIKTFLFWHLKDMGASTLLFSIISAVNGVAEVTMYLLSEKIIVILGQQNVLYLALICYSIRLFYYAFIRRPWLVLVVELLPGITSAAAWASLLSYVNINSKEGYKTTMQCILHSCHWGLGYGLGEVIGGIMVHLVGAQMSFIINGIICLVNLFAYVIIVNCCKSTEKTENGCEEEEHGEIELRKLLEFKRRITENDNENNEVE